MSQRDFRDAAHGRWRAILIAAGVGAQFLTGQHTACPCCGGKDRFRWDNKTGSGSSFCNACGARTGLDLVMAVKGLDFRGAREFVLAEVGQAPVETPCAPRKPDSALALRLWDQSHPLNGSDPASLYLAKRGLTLGSYPSMLRYQPRAVYVHPDNTKTHHPALISKLVSADRTQFTLQATFLDAEGNKAPGLQSPRKLLPGPVPMGGAVRLAASADTMGIAEGVETALSAAQLFDVPVWATLTSGLLSKWEPPETAKCILIFADADEKYGGQAAAYALAYKLAAKNYHVQVRNPPDLGMDWNDVITSGIGVLT